MLAELPMLAAVAVGFWLLQALASLGEAAAK